MRQPYVDATSPLTYAPRKYPAGKPSMKTASARPRFAAGYKSPISELPAGAQTASPTPTPSRAANIDAKFHVHPDAAVSRLQTATPIPSRRDRFFVSERRPIGTPMIAYNSE